MKLKDLKNPVEEVVQHLTEVGGPLLSSADEIRETLSSLAQLVKKTEERIALHRQELFDRIQKNYVDAEIETADVMTTRMKGL